MDMVEANEEEVGVYNERDGGEEEVDDTDVHFMDEHNGKDIFLSVVFIHKVLLICIICRSIINMKITSILITKKMTSMMMKMTSMVVLMKITSMITIKKCSRKTVTKVKLRNI